VRGLGAVAAVLGTLAFVVGAPVRSQRTARGDTLFSAATRDALDECAQADQGVRLLEIPPARGADFKESDPLNMLSSRASGASRGICTSAVQSISALQLAAWIRDGRRGLRVLDIRDPAAYATRHIPSAESAELMELSSVAPQAGETVVLYSDDDLLDLQGAAWLTRAGHARVHVVRGGMSAWLDEVIDPVVQGDSAATVAALSRYFGGVPRAASASDARTRARVRRTTGRLELVTRRGC
jgi:rhodanese-related sulfurtransferase